MGSTQDSYLRMTLAEPPAESVPQHNPAIEEISMDSQNALQNAAAFRQHSLNVMAAFVAQTNSSAALPFLSAAAGVIPNAVNPTASFVNFPMTAGTSTTGSLDQYAAQSLVYPSAYLTQTICSCGCSVQPCALHHRYTTPSFLAATTLATALENRAATAARIQQQQQPQQQQHSMSTSLSTLAASNVNVNIPPPIAQLPPAPLNLPSLPPTIRMGSSRSLKRPAPYQVSSQQSSNNGNNLQSYNNSSSQSYNTSSQSYNSSTSSTGLRGPKLRRMASFDNSSSGDSNALQSVNSNGTSSQNTVSMGNVNFNQRAVDLADVAASIDSVLQSTAQAMPPTAFPPPCSICAGCQTRLPPHPTCGCHHHHHCLNHHTICAVCSNNASSTQNYGSSSSGLALSSNQANYMAGISTPQVSQHNLPFTNVPRQPEINPVHSTLLAQRQAQQERDQQNTNIWYQRQFNPSLIGFDVVTRRLPQPVIMVPRLPPTMMDLSIFVLHPTDAVLSGAAGIPTTHQHATAEPQPVGASLDQIKKFSSVLAYVKDPDVPEQERERCTVCLVDFETGDDIRSLHCTHMFHVDCIDRWLVYNKKCPICRIDMDKAPTMLNMIEATVPSNSSHYVRAQR